MTIIQYLRWKLRYERRINKEIARSRVRRAGEAIDKPFKEIMK